MQRARIVRPISAIGPQRGCGSRRTHFNLLGRYARHLQQPVHQKKKGGDQEWLVYDDWQKQSGVFALV